MSPSCSTISGCKNCGRVSRPKSKRRWKGKSDVEEHVDRKEAGPGIWIGTAASAVRRRRRLLGNAFREQPGYGHTERSGESGGKCAAHPRPHSGLPAV